MFFLSEKGRRRLIIKKPAADVAVIKVSSMKKSLLSISALSLAPVLAQAQTDSVEKPLDKTEIALVYNQYFQEGNHSAVTGGVGTEQMSVSGPSLSYNRTLGKNAIGITLGSDIITSASVDKIDFVSSTSRLDNRMYVSPSFQRSIKDVTLSAGANVSMESDYFSLGGKLGISKEVKERQRDYALVFQVYNDDLRWGRLSTSTGHKPKELIYPMELRYKEWYDVHKRYSYNVKGSSSFPLNIRNKLGIVGELTYQNGLLSTPFHRVYFSDGRLGVEQLPEERWKAGLAIKWNSFVAGNMILRNTLDAYKDSWNITAISLSNETVIKVKRNLSLIPNLRFYMQKGTPYFKPYKMHASNETYFTSDYDLSNLNSINVGMGFKYMPYSQLTRKWLFNNLQFNYSYYRRSDGLQAHIFTLAFQIEKEK